MFQSKDLGCCSLLAQAYLGNPCRLTRSHVQKFFLYTHCIFVLIYRFHGEIVTAPSKADQLMGANQQ
ncbi:hypothetical protein EXN23_20910 [Agrobacterium salinitolerans]|uniref:Uncharacterized protein n=1 Tax=Agrobacterium salinitolerans TaxID=1183413 RepID=A0ABY3BJX6_9HYPH|nr:hypothetical protein EXN23_20910 [Agrobacterium salinitolerans]